jgi:Xaa-Pro aminopeptidase
MQSQGGGIAILPTGGLRPRNGTNPYPFRYDSQFYYLTGFAEPEAWLVLRAKADGSNESVLFCQSKDPETETWDGLRFGPDAAREAFGFDHAHANDDLASYIPKVLAGESTIFAPLHRSAIAELPMQIQRWIDATRKQARGLRQVPWRWLDLTPVLSQHRSVKDTHEQQLMRQAAAIAAAGHCEAMRAAKPGLTERFLEGELLRVFLQSGAQDTAYQSIVATGANACILHHQAGASVMKDNDLVLIDAGCELHGYASDITRTFPVSGRFTAPQAALYDIVLAAQQAAVAQTRPGVSFNAGHEAAVAVLSQGLIDEGILSGSLDDVIENKRYQPFYMHRTGHWLGLDVHDVGSYRLTEEGIDGADEPDWRPLEPGMVLTIEPGLYVRPAESVPEAFWDIGIRIEDDALVTAQGCDLLTRGVPVDRASIEALVQQAG